MKKNSFFHLAWTLELKFMSWTCKKSQELTQLLKTNSGTKSSSRDTKLRTNTAGSKSKKRSGWEKLGQVRRRSMSLGTLSWSQTRARLWIRTRGCFCWKHFVKRKFRSRQVRNFFSVCLNNRASKSFVVSQGWWNDAPLAFDKFIRIKF